MYIVDPLAIDDMTPLGRLLADGRVEKVMHSADYDIRSLDRDWDFHAAPLFDTSIAAAFLGSSRLGLDAVLKEHLGVEVTKTKRIQRSDWTRRPLSSESLEYAADDVRHLAALRNKLAGELARLGRLEWVKEECERLSRVRSQPHDPEWAFLSIKDVQRWTPRGLGVLRSLHRFREREALRRNTPPFKIISNGKLVELAASPERDLAAVGGLGRFGRGSDMARLRAAIHEGLKEGPVRLPKRGKPDSPRLGPGERDKAAARLQKLKDWRSREGAALGLDPALVWPVASLERLSRHAPIAGGRDGWPGRACMAIRRVWSLSGKAYRQPVTACEGSAQLKLGPRLKQEAPGCRGPLLMIPGRSGRTRTPDIRFWRPALYQLSYAPNGTPGGTRTPDARLRTPPLYPG